MKAPIDQIAGILEEAGLVASDVQERFFPGEHWLIVYVPEDGLVAAQSFAGTAEAELNKLRPEEQAIVLTFRPERKTPEEEVSGREGQGRLHGKRIDQLVQLLEARSRTSDALPSLKYVEDPRATLSTIGASRHHLIYGRRGVGKTALMLESKRDAERAGHLTVWINAHVLRGIPPEEAFAVVAGSALDVLARHGGTSQGAGFAELNRQAEELSKFRSAKMPLPATAISDLLPGLNSALRSVLRDGLIRLYIYVDDFYLTPVEQQPRFLDLLSGMLRDCDGWIKVASIERLTRPWDPSNRQGLEVPHDASILDLDVTLEDPSATQSFLESVLSNYLKAVGLKGPTSIIKPDARGRLVLASGGVPRDYLNLVASSIGVARTARPLAKEVGKEDVARAAGLSAQFKRRDLEQDVASKNAASLVASQDRIASAVRTETYTYFRINVDQKTHPAYVLLAQLVDLRFAHLVQASLSDQHRPGVKYEAYVLDLSEFSDVRLKRGLNVLDLSNGRWSWRLTGQNRTMKALTATQFRDQLRQSPVVDLDMLDDLIVS